MSNNNFGRDDMNALLGGPSEEMAAFRPSTMVPGRDLKKKANSEEPDISTMTASETAAMLLEKKANRSNNTTRYRTNRTLVHHELAKELSAELEIKGIRSKNQHHQQNRAEEEENSGEEEEFVATTANKRSRVLPQVVHTKAEPKVLGRRKRRVYDSSSSDGDSRSEGERAQRRRRSRQRDSDDDGNSSSSSSDGEKQRRRRRQQARQQLEEAKSTPPKSQTIPKRTIDSERVDRPTKDAKSVSAARAKLPPPRKPQSSSDGGSSDSDSSSEASSSSSQSSSSDEDEPVLAKPVFVPKSRRNLIPTEEKKLEEEEARLEREKEREEKRKMQSRALVAQQLANADSSALIDEIGDDEAGGATNAPPSDDDDVDIKKERDAWEMRELGRLLAAMDQEKQRAAAEYEYRRRRQMTDEECMKEDIQVGRYQAPGSKRDEGKPEGGMQRFYHRGAYYMDEEEWTESDVRHKAAEYAKAATGDDKIDKKQLPEIMQVKKFGFARQNHRYKGLAKEDTTDRRMEILPLVKKKGAK